MARTTGERRCLPEPAWARTEIQFPLGAGGMGEVYLAEDTRLHRKVAIKLLPADSVNDEEAKRRLLREARAAAALDHPNICTIHEVNEAEGRPFIVMQYVEGETLAASMVRKPLDLVHALTVARQVASALAEAHRHGIVHLDIKPQNIMLAPHGAVKVLDFGLAEVASAIGPHAESASEVTAPGVIAGTMPYMSPEQLRGEELDGRSDIFSFGSVLCELVTGAHPFAEGSVAETMSAILTREPPPLRRESGAVPAELERIVRQCLEKDRARRYQAIRDLVSDLENVGREVVSKEDSRENRTEPLPGSGSGRTFAARRKPVLGAVAAAIVIAGLFFTWLLSRAPPGERPIRSIAEQSSPMTQFQLALPSGAPLAVTPWLESVAMSGDGSLAFRTTEGAWGIRSRDGRSIQRIGGGGLTVHGAFFSPNGEWLGFLDAADAGRNHPAPLMKVPVHGGPAVFIASVGTRFLGASWGADDTILFAVGAGVFRVSAGGGTPQLVASGDQARGEVLSSPEVLPGGRWALVTVTLEGSGERTIAALDLRTGMRRVLPLQGGGRARFVSGHLVYTARGTMYTVAFDVDALNVLSDPVALITNVRDDDFALSDEGTLAYVSGAAENRELVWVDRQGLEETIPAPPRQYNYPRLSPDGNKVALDILGPNRDIWMWDLHREELTRFTSDPAENLMPVWSLDSKMIAYGQRSDISKLFWQAAGGGSPELLNDGSVSRIPVAFTPGDKELIFSEEARDILALSLDGSHRVRPLLIGPHSEGGGSISPNGRWMAYSSNESGRFEVYVCSYKDVNGTHWKISTGGGSQPLWSRNGRELFYRDPDGPLMAVSVETEPTFVPGQEVKLFEGTGYLGAGGLVMGRAYDVSLNDLRFLMVKRPTAASDAPPHNTLIVVQNWTEELKRQAPAR